MFLFALDNEIGPDQCENTIRHVRICYCLRQKSLKSHPVFRTISAVMDIPDERKDKKIKLTAEVSCAG